MPFIFLISSVMAGPANALDPQKLISQFAHTAFSTQDGIPGPVRAITQTRDGYLWLGSEAGLYRFDGLRFVRWEPSFGERFPSESVWSLFTAGDGSLWIGYGSGGIGVLRGGHLKNYPPGQGVPEGGILSITEDRNGSIWAGGAYGLSRFQNGAWHRVGAEMGYPAPAAQSLLVDRRGNLWVATDGLDFRLSKDLVRRNTVLTLPPNAQRFSATGLGVGMVWSMSEAPDGSVWIADTSGHAARRMSGQAGGSTEIGVGAESMCILFDNDQSLWVGLVEGGLRRASDLRRPKSASLDRFQPNEGLSGGLVYATFLDREGNVWFGTSGGLDRFRENKVVSFSVKEGLVPDQRISLTSTADGSVWSISYGGEGLRRFDSARIGTSKLASSSLPDMKDTLSLYAEGKNSVWVGGNSKLARGVDGKFSFIKAAGIERGAYLEAIAKDATGKLWIALRSREGAEIVLQLVGSKWIDFGRSVHLPDYRCRVLYGDEAGRMWLGFENGEVAVFEGGRFREYTSKDGLPGGRVFAITADRKGQIWIGGQSGLSHFDGRRFVTLTKDSGLPGNSVSAVLEDKDGSFWLGGALAILRVSRQEVERALASPSYRMQGVSFDASDGLRGLPRQREPFPTATLAADGRLWFATSGGIAVIDPRNLPRNLVAPPVVIEDVIADDRSFSASSGLLLHPRTRNLEFHFTALSLGEPERVRFRYKLEGYDDDWRGPVSSREVRYTNPPPRNYRFRVTACNNDGVWNEAGTFLDFSIAPAYYQTTWFLVSCLAAFLAMLWALYQLRLRHLAREFNMGLEARVSERTRIARELHDTLLQSFQGLLLRFQAATNHLPPGGDKQDFECAIAQAAKAITEGRDAVEQLRSTTVLTADLALAIKTLGEELAANETNPSSAVFNVEVEGTPKNLHPILRDEVYRIAVEALRNAFRHAEAQRIEIELRYNERQFRLRIRDDGKGIDPKQLDEEGRKGHFGLRGMRERATSMGGRLTVWSELDSGTELELSIPASHAYKTSLARHRSWFAEKFSGKDA